MTSPIPDDTIVRRRTWIIAGVLSVVIALLGVGIAFAVLALRGPGLKQTPSYTPVTSSETTSAASRSTSSTSTMPTSSALSTASAGATSTTSTPQNQIVHSARIAYRYGGKVYVANENATGDMAVADSGSGAFSLSPDGRTLAIMVGATTETDHAVLIDVETQAQVPLGYAVELPAWAPDSSWVAYTAKDKTTGLYSVHRVNRDGTGDTVVLTSAADPEIAPDGGHIAYTSLSVAITNSPTQTVKVYDIAAGRPQTVPDSYGVSSFAFASDGLLYFTTSGTGRALRSASPSLSQSSFVAPLPTGTETQTPGRLFPSPDASMLLFSMTGDDGYSRIAVADIARKKIAMIAARLDEAPLGWLLDGSAILYIEGNAYNQESTSLLRMNADGSHRVLVKNGASL